ncbi:MAG: S24 family peptidase, partial [Anaerolineales bacterium]|nr:S24 family peptidase [Anaerolineales bacterium]
YEQENDLQAKRRCDVQIQECNKALKRIESGLPPKSSSHSHAKWPSLRLIQHVYDFGHASLVGKFVLEDKPITAVEINQVLIDGKPYELLAVQEDVHAITIPPGHQLFWLKIAGQSMNQASPTPIHEGDYVLIDHNRLPSNGDIVFAQINHPPTPAERAGIIKRLKGSSLYSESDLSIPPIPLTRVTIKGIVIAIAKPVV